MTDLEKRLQAQLTGQAIMIEALLRSCVAAGVLDADELTDVLDARAEAPTAIFSDARESALVRAELRAWADMVNDLRPNSGA